MGQLEHAGRGGAAPYRTPAVLSAGPSVNQATPAGVVLTGTAGRRVTGLVLRRTSLHLPDHPINTPTGSNQRRRLPWITR